MGILDRMKQIEHRSDIPCFLDRYNLNKVVVEIGVRYGYNLRQLLVAKPQLLAAVDHWAAGVDQDTSMGQAELNRIYRKVCLDFLHEPNVKILRMSSLEAAAFFPLFSIDYVYIDANHTKEGCLKDMSVWWDRVRQGGIMAGHDYIDVEARDGTPFGVIDAVREFMVMKEIPQECLHFTKHGYRSWFIYKVEGE